MSEADHFKATDELYRYERTFSDWLKQNHPDIPNDAEEVELGIAPAGYDGEFELQLSYCTPGDRWHFIDLGNDFVAVINSLLMVSYNQGYDDAIG